MTIGKLCFYFLVLLAGGYTLLSYYPNVLFAKQTVYNNIEVYSADVLPAEAEALFDRVNAKISSTDFFSPEQKFEIYLAESSGEYSFFAPSCRSDYACIHPITDKIFIASADLSKNSALAPGGTGLKRVLEMAITGELVKAQLKNKLGALSYFNIPIWKRDGYASHISGETADLAESGACSPGDDFFLRQLEGRLMVEMLRNESLLGYPVMMKENNSYESMQKRLKTKYCGS